MITNEVLDGQNLPEFLRFTPVNGTKAPYLEDWQNNPQTWQQITAVASRDNRCRAIGLLTGEPSEGTLALDKDGESADPLIEKLSGVPYREALPKTVGVTSGKPGRCQYLYKVPECFWPFLQSKTIFTGFKDELGKEEQLDFRWNGKQSVILGQHPETEGYRWPPGQAPWEVEVAECPLWIVRQILSFHSLLPKVRKDWSDRDWALEYLSYISNQDLDWYQWRDVLLGLHYAGVEEEIAWVWSASSEKHTDNGFEAVWKYIDDNCPNPIGLGTLGELAKQGGWKGKSPSSHSPSGEDFGSLKAETDSLLTQSSQDFNLKQIFPDELATPLNAIAKVFNQPAIAVAAPLLSIAGSLLRVGTLIRIQVRSDFAQPPIIWAAEVGDSDSGKSPIISILKKPLSSLQSKDYQDYLKRKAQHEWDLADWDGTQKKNRGPKPKLAPMRQFLFDDFTTEAIADSLQHYPEHGALVCVDELAAVLYGFNQYKKRGNDRQRWLTLYDGSELNISRKTQEPIYLSRTNLPIVGGIQPVVLREVIGDLEHVDGFWPRFYYVRMPLSVMPSVDWHNDTDIGLNAILSKAYQALDDLPAKTYCLSAECQGMWDDWHHRTEQERFNEPHPALRAIYRKARARAARVALVVHCLNAVIEDRTPADTISHDTLSAAIAFTKYGIDQIRSIYADFGVVDNPEAARIARFVDRFQNTGWIDWLKVRRWWNSKEKPNKESCLKFMTQLVSLEYARDNGQSKDYQIQIIDFRQRVKNSPHTTPSNGLTVVKDVVKMTTDFVKTSETEVETPDLEVFDEKRRQNDVVLDDNQSHASQELEGDFDYLTKHLSQEKSQNESTSSDPCLEDEAVTEPQPKLKSKDYWRTPNTDEQPILTMVSEILGEIGLDPTADAAKAVPARHHFSEAENCLGKSWKDLGSVFMNPPFSISLPFVKKLVEEYQSGHIPEAIALLLAGTLQNKGTGSLIWGSASAVCHWGCGKARRRIGFLNEEGTPILKADFNCVLVYWGNKPKQFKEVFQQYGNVSFNEPESPNDGFSHLVKNNLQPISQEDLSLVKEVVNSSQSLVTPSHELTTPRQACIVSNGQVEVNETKLDLNYQPEIPIPTWQPSRVLKPYEQLSKLYLDIETTGLDPEHDCVLLVGFRDEQGQVTILDDVDEAVLLQQTWQFIRDKRPDVLVGHNLFSFDLPFLMRRWGKHCIRHHFKIDDKTRTITSSSFHGKPIQFTPIRLAGTQILDTFQQICIWDKSAAKLTSYGLKPSVKALGLRVEERLELTAQQIQAYAQAGNLEPIKTYLEADLEDTQLLADFLLPVVYYQRKVVPGLSLQDLAVASPALKAQKLHESLINGSRPQADTQLKYEGGLIRCHRPGLHPQAAKIDISSLYPSIMLRYGICSQKDPEHRFLGVMQYMREERLRLKALAKSGHQQADHEQNALKILINGSYGFLGTKGYSFNDYSAAALVTAYGRKTLRLMEDTIEACGAALVESDTDGAIFSHSQPEQVYQAVCQALPDGVIAELEFSDCGLYIPKAKSYVIVYPNDKTTIKGLLRKRDRYPLDNQFPVQFLKHYFLESPDVAQAYYEQTRAAIANRQISIEQLTITRKIGTAEKQLVQRGLGQPGEIVSYYYIEEKRCNARSGKSIKSRAVESTRGDYWIDWYLTRLDQQYQEITGKAPKPIATGQLTLLIGRAS